MLDVTFELEALDEAAERLVPSEPVLITEHEVTLGTAVALRTRPATRRRWREATQGLLSAAQRVFVSAAPAERPTRRHYPKRYAYLENACMARAMERL